MDYHVEAPYLVDGGANEEQSVAASFEPCIMSCGDEDASSLDCDGVRSIEGDIPLCPDVASKHDFNEGWCTGHITQRQRWQKGVGDRYVFSLKLCRP